MSPNQQKRIEVMQQIISEVGKLEDTKERLSKQEYNIVSIRATIEQLKSNEKVIMKSINKLESELAQIPME